MKQRMQQRTREVYLCAAGKAGQIGVEYRGDDPKIMGINLTFFLLCGNIEAAIKTVYPGRRYWIELGNDEAWMQTVEYGAFSGKPHKKASLESKSKRAVATRKDVRDRGRNRPDGKKRVRP